jgi:ferredoxin
MALRKIVRIDEELCDGCGECVPSCAEGAIQIIDGKARLIRDDYCDGLGACLGECPQGALSIEEREAPSFDEAAVEEHLAKTRQKEEESPAQRPMFRPLPSAPGPAGGCPSARIMSLGDREESLSSPRPERSSSALSHWPVKLKLVPPGAPFLHGAKLLLAADCAPFALANFHSQLLEEHVVVIGCPKFDDYVEARAKLTEFLRSSGLESLTVVTMEVPCCFGYWKMAMEAATAAGVLGTLPIKQVVIGIRGEVLETREAEVA